MGGQLWTAIETSRPETQASKRSGRRLGAQSQDRCPPSPTASSGRVRTRPKQSCGHRDGAVGAAGLVGTLTHHTPPTSIRHEVTDSQNFPTKGPWEPPPPAPRPSWQARTVTLGSVHPSRGQSGSPPRTCLSSKPGACKCDLIRSQRLRRCHYGEDGALHAMAGVLGREETRTHRRRQPVGTAAEAGPRQPPGSRQGQEGPRAQPPPRVRILASACVSADEAAQWVVVGSRRPRAPVQPS